MATYNMFVGIVGWIVIGLAILFNNSGAAALGFLLVSQLNMVNFGI